MGRVGRVGRGVGSSRSDTMSNIMSDMSIDGTIYKNVNCFKNQLNF